MQKGQNQKVIARFAPSPTGLLHLGNYRTAIFSYLFAKKNEGEFVLRIEDTDKERSKKEYEDNILESLEWLGLPYDKFYRQSEHVKMHKMYLERMIKEGSAYISKEEAKDGSGIIKELVRFKNPNIDVTFSDEIKGEVTMNTKDLGDFVIAKNLEEPLFHLAVVVDDFEAGITHVIRGEDHVSNTPRQILIQRAIGAPTPTYAHLPLVLGSDKLKLSKRRGALPLTEYKNRGYLPEAVLNGIAFIGWNPGTDKELYSKKELVDDFELSHVQKSPAIFNEEKLDWFNKEHMKLLPEKVRDKEIVERLRMNLLDAPEDYLLKLCSVVSERISKWGDVDNLVRGGELEYYFRPPVYETTELYWKKIPAQEETKKHLEWIKNTLNSASASEFSSVEKIKNLIFDYATENGRGQVLWPLRVALSGKEKSPDPFTIIYILGKEETVSRVNQAINRL